MTTFLRSAFISIFARMTKLFYVEEPPLKVSEEGLFFIKSWEKLELKAYLPTLDDVPTIGYGTTRIDGAPVRLGMEITEAQAEDFFKKDVEQFERVVLSSVRRTLSQHQLDALVSFSYNVGAQAFRDSTLLDLLNAGKPSRYIAAQFPRWVYQGKKVLRGLVRRRDAEKTLFELGIYKPNA